MASGRHSILVVDDSTDIRETLRDVFEASGYQVDTAANGVDALARLDVAPLPCMVVLDLMMPVMDGWQVLDAVRNQRSPGVAAVPITVLSGALDRVQMRELKGQFRCEVLAKPAELEQLLELAQQCCAK